MVLGLTSSSPSSGGGFESMRLRFLLPPAAAEPWWRVGKGRVDGRVLVVSHHGPTTFWWAEWPMIDFRRKARWSGPRAWRRRERREQNRRGARSTSPEARLQMQNLTPFPSFIFSLPPKRPVTGCVGTGKKRRKTGGSAHGFGDTAALPLRAQLENPLANGREFIELSREGVERAGG